MKNERKFYICPHCGNLVGLIEAGGGQLVCCGEPMKLIKANTEDASHEKHVPVATVSDNILTVEVGSVPHPMTDAHHINWISVAQGDRTQRISLDKTGEPKATFCVKDEPLTVYAYCNLHGLWATEI